MSSRNIQGKEQKVDPFLPLLASPNPWGSLRLLTFLSSSRVSPGLLASWKHIPLPLNGAEGLEDFRFYTWEESLRKSAFE